MASRPAPAPAALRRAVLIHLVIGALGVGAAAHALRLAHGLPAVVVPGALAAFAIVAAYALSGLAAHARQGRWGDANRVTLFRGGLACLLAGLALAAPALPPALLWPACVTAVTALALDGVDGWVARRQGLASAYGARFDMELDTLLTLVLALLLWRLGEVGAWVLLLGLLRPLFVAAAQVWPQLTRPLPFSQRRRVVCVVQVAVLAAGLAPVVEPPLTGLAAGAALALLLFSFAVDTVWLFRHGSPAARMAHGHDVA